MIITTNLANALNELRRNFELPDAEIARAHPELVSTFRTAAIKSFEYAYELSVRLIRRSLEAKASAPGEIDQMEFRKLMRTAAEAGLIDDPLAWLQFREKRNITSHTYDEALSLDVLAVIPLFMTKARNLLENLARGSDASE